MNDFIEVTGQPTVARRHVLILIENLPAPFDRRVWQEATTLRDKGFDVSIICPTGSGCEAIFEQIDGIDIHRYRLPVEASGAAGYLIEYAAALWNTFRLARCIWKSKPFDAIHACNPPDLFFLVGRRYQRRHGVKFVFDHHDVNPELFEAKFGHRGLLWRLMIWLERMTFRTADVVISTNQSYRRIAIDRGGVDSQRVFVVRSGPRLDRIRQVTPNPSLKHGRRYLVGYVGTMGAQEGIDLLLESVRIIVHDLGRDDIHFGLVGGGTSVGEMKRLARSLGVDDHVTFAGRLPDQQMLEMLSTADVCVNPDTANAMNDISTMNKIVEFMALGKPIVQFDLVEGRYSAENASLYARRNDPRDFAEKILTLLADPTLREEMGRLGRQRVEDVLEWKHSIPNLLAAYQSLWPRPEAPSVATRVSSDQDSRIVSDSDRSDRSAPDLDRARVESLPMGRVN